MMKNGETWTILILKNQLYDNHLTNIYHSWPEAFFGKEDANLFKIRQGLFIFIGRFKQIVKLYSQLFEIFTTKPRSTSTTHLWVKITLYF